MHRAFQVVAITIASRGIADAGPGDCAVPTDCAVFGARCEQTKCTLKTVQQLFPTLDLTEIDLSDPADLAVTTAQPEFQWTPPMGADLVAIVVFRSPPRYGKSKGSTTEDLIVNFSDAVWAWHSNLPGGSVSTGTVHYSEGRTVRVNDVDPIDNNALSNDPPVALANGTYYWGVWGWNGASLTHRSELRSFSVTRENVTGPLCETGVCFGPSTVQCVNDRSTGPDAYCVLSCASDVDCFQGMVCDLTHLDVAPWGICKADLGPCQCSSDDECDEDLGVCHDPFESAGGCSTTYLAVWAILLALFAVRQRSLARKRPC